MTALRGWVKAGASWPSGRILSPFEFTTDRRAGYDWWSFQTVTRPKVPPVKKPEWPRNPIDSFVLRELEERGISPAPPADKATFIRRVTYDLLGLPPTPEEIEDYAADVAPEADEKLIDRLLASPHYGAAAGQALARRARVMARATAMKMTSCAITPGTCT